MENIGDTGPIRGTTHYEGTKHPTGFRNKNFHISNLDAGDNSVRSKVTEIADLYPQDSLWDTLKDLSPYEKE